MNKWLDKQDGEDLMWDIITSIIERTIKQQMRIAALEKRLADIEGLPVAVCEDEKLNNEM